MYLYDTNIFLEILLGQSATARARAALELMTERNRGCVTSFSIHAIEAIVGRSKAKTQVIADFLSFVDEHPFLDRYSTTTQEELKICELATQAHLNFDDALQLFVSKTRQLTLVTFDRDFLKIKGVKILFPK